MYLADYIKKIFKVNSINEISKEQQKYIIEKLKLLKENKKNDNGNLRN